MKSPNPNDIVRTATELSANHNKLELVAIARGMGWRGDHARVPMLQIALFVATKLQTGDSEQTGTSRDSSASQQDDSKASQQDDSSASQQDDSNASQQDDSNASQQDDSNASQQTDSNASQQDDSQSSQQEGQQDGQQEGQQDGQQEGQQDGQQEGQQDDSNASQQDGQQEGQQDDSNASQQDGQQEGQQDDSNASQQAEQPWDDAEQSTDSGEYLELLKQSSITLAHPMLEKVWRLAVKAKRNVLLIGGAGSGKTMIGQQLAQLLRVPFSSISCTQGMSENDLTGTLLPIRTGGAFEYVPAPFVDCVQSQSVFLLDELNAADGNVLLVANSILANGFLTIPCKIDSPTIRKHPDSIIVAGLNEASDIYNSRGLLDGATLDRFYPVRIPYDLAYIKNKFVVDGKKGRARSPRWQPSAVKVDQVMLNDALAWFMTAFDLAQSGKLNRIVANRFADNLVAALKAGIPFDEVKADLTADWTDDERARIGG